MPRQQYSEREARSTLRPVVVWQPEGRKPVEFELQESEELTVGRDATNKLQIESPYISKSHAVFRYRSGKWALEDLDSANGTKVNGNPIRMHFGLQPGDRIEVGDAVLQFVDPAAKDLATPAGGRKGPSKFLRLAFVAVLCGGVMVGILMFLRPRGPTETPATTAQNSPAPASTVGAADPAAKPAAAASAAPVRVVDTVLIDRAIERAKASGVGEADALFDEGLMNLDTGRYRDATQLLAAALQRRPGDAGIKERLADARAALEKALVVAVADANLAEAQLRRQDARLAWERVLAMTYPGDALYAQGNDHLQKLNAQPRVTER